MNLFVAHHFLSHRKKHSTIVESSRDVVQINWTEFRIEKTIEKGNSSRIVSVFFFLSVCVDYFSFVLEIFK